MASSKAKKAAAKLGPGGVPRDRNCEDHCGCTACRKALAHDAEVDKLERKLKAMHEARKGRWIVANWFWCVGCGAHKVMVDHDPAFGPHMRHGRCRSCDLDVRLGHVAPAPPVAAA